MSVPVATAQASHRQGVIVTWREQKTRELLSIEATELLVGDALRWVIDCVETQLRGHWMIVSISTPKSILRDLQGQRGTRGAQTRRATPGRAAAREERPSIAGDPREVERTLLGKIGRLDLLEPPPFSSNGTPERMRRR